MLLILALLVGTLMPGSWRDAGASAFPSYLRVTTLAHALLFASIVFVARVSGLSGGKTGWLVIAAAALAASTELLQLLAAERHPSLTDVAVDLAGTLAGLGAALTVGRPAPNR